MIKFIRNLLSPNREVGCVDSNCERVANILYAVMDDEASEVDKVFFKDHVDHCQPCLEKYNIETAVIETVKTKVESVSCPEDVKASVLEKIKSEN